MWYTYTMEYNSAIKKNEIMRSAATWMDLKTVILSKVRQRLWYHLHVETKKEYKWTYPQKRNIVTDIENKFMAMKE